MAEASEVDLSSELLNQTFTLEVWITVMFSCIAKHFSLLITFFLIFIFFKVRCVCWCFNSACMSVELL